MGVNSSSERGVPQEGEQSAVESTTELQPEIRRGLSVIIPTYNESQNIEVIISQLKHILNAHEVTYEIIVVDDDSPDNTWWLVDLLFNDENVRVIRRIEERGLGSAIAEGITQSQFNYCTVIDADLQHPPEFLPGLLIHLQDDPDLVIGSRYTDFGQIKGWPWSRRLISKGAIAIAKAVLPAVRPIADPLSGFFVVKRSAIEGQQVNPIGYKFLLEILVQCDLTEVREVPYEFVSRERGVSKLSIQEYVAFLKHLYRLRRGEQG